MSTIYLIIGTIDVCMILLLGFVGAALVILGRDTTQYLERVVPAVAILVGTSVAAGIAMAVTRWMAGI